LIGMPCSSWTTPWMEPAVNAATRAVVALRWSLARGVARSARAPDWANNTRAPTAAADVINLEMPAMSGAPLV
jgi:hypothetical protein